MKFEELDIHKIGNTIQFAGAIFEGEDQTLLCYMPWALEEDFGVASLEPLVMNLEEWTKFLRQCDLVETEVLEKAEDGKLVKAIVRKCQRQIDARVSWAVYQRDGYRCRYCGKGGIPLTVDHVILWEEGGPSIPENLITSCRKCNRVRGRTPYAEWMEHEYYLDHSKRLPIHVLDKNREVVGQLGKIPRYTHKRRR